MGAPRGAPPRARRAASPRGGLAELLASIPDTSLRVALDEAGEDLATSRLEGDDDVTFLLGDHLGLTDAAIDLFAPTRRVSLGPVSVMAEDAIALAHNALDRAAARGAQG